MGLQVRGNTRTKTTRSSNVNRGLDKNLKLKDTEHITKGKVPLNRQASREQRARLIHCPRLCQQTAKGGYGRKTYDPVKNHCFGCNYQK